MMKQKGLCRFFCTEDDINEAQERAADPKYREVMGTLNVEAEWAR